MIVTFRRLTAVFGVWVVLSAGARADVVYRFTYQGSGTDDHGLAASDRGYGSFTFNGNPSSPGVSDLASFSYTVGRSDTGGNTAVYSYGLGDVSTFAAGVNAGGTLTSLNLTTLALAAQSNPGGFAPNALQVSSLTTGAMADGIGGIITSGAITAAADPMVYHFTYSGTGIDGYGLNATDNGYGYFSLNTNAGTAGVGDLFTFYFAVQRQDTGGHVSSYIYDNPLDVSSFMAKVNGAGALTALTLSTVSLPTFVNSGVFGNGAFSITSITTGEMRNDSGAVVTSGRVNVTPSAAVPEPSTLVLSSVAGLVMIVRARGRSTRKLLQG